MRINALRVCVWRVGDASAHVMHLQCAVGVLGGLQFPSLPRGRHHALREAVEGQRPSLRSHEGRRRLARQRGARAQARRAQNFISGAAQFAMKCLANVLAPTPVLPLPRSPPGALLYLERPEQVECTVQ